jgi:hypothetical protein
MHVDVYTVSCLLLDILLTLPHASCPVIQGFVCQRYKLPHLPVYHVNPLQNAFALCPCPSRRNHPYISLHPVIYLSSHHLNHLYHPSIYYPVDIRDISTPLTTIWTNTHLHLTNFIRYSAELPALKGPLRFTHNLNVNVTTERVIRSLNSLGRYTVSGLSLLYPVCNIPLVERIPRIPFVLHLDLVSDWTWTLSFRTRSYDYLSFTLASTRPQITYNHGNYEKYQMWATSTWWKVKAKLIISPYRYRSFHHILFSTSSHPTRETRFNL